MGGQGLLSWKSLNVVFKEARFCVCSAVEKALDQGKRVQRTGDPEAAYSTAQKKSKR